MYSKLSDQIWLEFLTAQNRCTSFSFPHHPITWQASTIQHPDLTISLHESEVGWFVVFFFFHEASLQKVFNSKICQKVKRVKSELEAGKLNRSPLLPFHSCVEIPSVSVKQGLDTMETQNLWRQTSTEKNPEIYTECCWKISRQRMAFLPQWISLCKNKVICSKWKCFTCI